MGACFSLRYKYNQEPLQGNTFSHYSLTSDTSCLDLYPTLKFVENDQASGSFTSEARRDSMARIDKWGQVVVVDATTADGYGAKDSCSDSCCCGCSCYHCCIASDVTPPRTSGAVLGTSDGAVLGTSDGAIMRTSDGDQRTSAEELRTNVSGQLTTRPLLTSGAVIGGATRGPVTRDVTSVRSCNSVITSCTSTESRVNCCALQKDDAALDQVTVGHPAFPYEPFESTLDDCDDICCCEEDSMTTSSADMASLYGPSPTPKPTVVVSAKLAPKSAAAAAVAFLNSLPQRLGFRYLRTLVTGGNGDSSSDSKSNQSEKKDRLRKKRKSVTATMTSSVTTKVVTSAVTTKVVTSLEAVQVNKINKSEEKDPVLSHSNGLFACEGK